MPEKKHEKKTVVHQHTMQLNKDDIAELLLSKYDIVVKDRSRMWMGCTSDSDVISVTWVNEDEVG